MLTWFRIASRIATDRRARAAVRLLFTDDPQHRGDPELRATVRGAVGGLHPNDQYVVLQLARTRQHRRNVLRSWRKLRRARNKTV